MKTKKNKTVPNKPKKKREAYTLPQQQLSSTDKARMLRVALNNIYDYSATVGMQRDDVSTLDNQFARFSMLLHNCKEKMRLGYEQLCEEGHDNALISFQDVTLLTSFIGVDIDQRTLSDVCRRAATTDAYKTSTNTDSESERALTTDIDMNDDRKLIDFEKCLNGVLTYFRHRLYSLNLAEIKGLTRNEVLHNYSQQHNSNSSNDSNHYSHHNRQYSTIYHPNHSDLNEPSALTMSNVLTSQTLPIEHNNNNNNDNLFLTNSPPKRESTSQPAPKHSHAAPAPFSFNRHRSTDFPAGADAANATNNYNSSSSGLPPVRVAKINTLARKKKAFAKAGFDESLARPTPRVLHYSNSSTLLGSNAFNNNNNSINTNAGALDPTRVGAGSMAYQQQVEMLRNELQIAQQGVLELNKRVDTNIAWVQTHCDTSGLSANYSERTKQKCRNMATERITTVYGNFLLTTYQFTMHKWRTAMQYDKLQELSKRYAKVKGVQLLTTTVYEVLTRQLLKAWVPWLNHVKLQRYKEREAASIEIARVVRGFLGRVHFHNFMLAKKAVVIQSLLRMRKGYKELLFRRKLREMRAKTSAAVVVQEFFQGLLVVKHAKAEAHRRRRIRAAVKIQKVARGGFGRARFAQILAEHNAAEPDRVLSPTRAMTSRSSKKQQLRSRDDNDDNMSDTSASSHGSSMSTSSKRFSFLPKAMFGSRGTTAESARRPGSTADGAKEGKEGSKDSAKDGKRGGASRGSMIGFLTGGLGSASKHSVSSDAAESDAAAAVTRVSASPTMFSRFSKSGASKDEDQRSIASAESRESLAQINENDMHRTASGRYVDDSDAALAIQKIARGKLARAQSKKVLEEKRKTGFMSHFHMPSRRSADAATPPTTTAGKPVTADGAASTHSERSTVSGRISTMFGLSHSDDHAKAATNIQKIARGKLTRNRSSSKKDLLAAQSRSQQQLLDVGNIVDEASVASTPAAVATLSIENVKAGRSGTPPPAEDALKSGRASSIRSIVSDRPKSSSRRFASGITNLFTGSNKSNTNSDLDDHERPKSSTPAPVAAAPLSARQSPSEKHRPKSASLFGGFFSSKSNKSASDDEGAPPEHAKADKATIPAKQSATAEVPAAFLEDITTAVDEEEQVIAPNIAAADTPLDNPLDTVTEGDEHVSTSASLAETAPDHAFDDANADLDADVPTPLEIKSDSHPTHVLDHTTAKDARTLKRLELEKLQKQKQEELVKASKEKAALKAKEAENKRKVEEAKAKAAREEREQKLKSNSVHHPPSEAKTKKPAAIERPADASVRASTHNPPPRPNQSRESVRKAMKEGESSTPSSRICVQKPHAPPGVAPSTSKPSSRVNTPDERAPKPPSLPTMAPDVASTKIQSMARRRLSVARVDGMRARRTAAVKIQRVARGKQGRKRFNHIHQAEMAAIQEQAVIKLQTLVRIFTAKARMQRKRRERQAELEHIAWMQQLQRNDSTKQSGKSSRSSIPGGNIKDQPAAVSIAGTSASAKSMREDGASLPATDDSDKANAAEVVNTASKSMDSIITDHTHHNGNKPSTTEEEPITDVEEAVEVPPTTQTPGFAASGDEQQLALESDRRISKVPSESIKIAIHDQVSLEMAEKLKRLEALERSMQEKEKAMMEAHKRSEERALQMEKALQKIEERAKAEEADRFARQQLLMMAAGPMSHRSDYSQRSLGPRASSRGPLISGRSFKDAPPTARSARDGIPADAARLTYEEQEWVQLWDPAEQAWYWYCEATGAAQWDAPGYEHSVSGYTYDSGYESAGAMTDYSSEGNYSQGNEFGDDSEFGEGDDWQEYWDEQAQAKYWYNNATGEASWTKPEHLNTERIVGSARSALGSRASASLTREEVNSGGGGGGDGDWVSYLDEDTGQEYWYNTRTGESSWA